MAAEGKVKEKLLKDVETGHERVTYDDILEKLGEFGLDQKISYLMFCLPYITSAMQLLGWVFVGATLPHMCQLPDGNNTEEWQAESCQRTDLQTNISYKCEDGWEYDRTHVKDTVVADWDLVCEKEGLRATIGAAPMVGYLAGGFVFGILTDKIGRKPTFMIANILMVTGGLLASIAPEFFTFVAARVLTGFAIAGVEAACFVMGMELVGPSKRTLAGIVCWFFETTGLLMAVFLAWLFPYSWRLLQTLYSVPAILFLSYWWLAPESVRWLVAKGENRKARNLIMKSAQRNKVEIKEELIEKMENTIMEDLKHEREGGDKTYTAVDLFRYPNLRYKTLILLFCWLTCASLYYVLLLDQSELSDDKYLGFLITAAVQIPGYFYVIFTLERPIFGRKRSMCIFLIISGAALCTHPFVSVPWLRIGLSVVGRFAANCSYTILNLFSAEQFPTVVRGVGMGFAVVVSRIGTILAPYILLLGNYSPILFGSLALLSGLLALLLPETLGQTMPETLQDGERLGLNIPCKKKHEQIYEEEKILK